jgi:Crp-like helix-turn-helix domain
MAAALHRLRSKPERLREEQAAALRQLVLAFPGLPEPAVGSIVAAIDRETVAENGWTFVMLSPAQNRAVVNWLLEHSSRPQKAVSLWSLLFEHLRRDTGEIMLSREQMAEQIGEAPGDVSRIMGELEQIGAISRRREKVSGMRGPGMVRYFMNPNVATHLGGKARERAQAEASPLKLAPREGRKRPKLAPVE